MPTTNTPVPIYYPDENAPVAPLENLFKLVADSVAAGFSSGGVPRVADLAALFTSVGNAGDMLRVIEGGAIFQYVGSGWVQRTEARFASTSVRDTAYAKASGVYRVPGVARVRIDGRSYPMVWAGTASVGSWVAEVGMIQLRPPTVDPPATASIDAGGTGVMSSANDTAFANSLLPEFDHHVIDFSLNGTVTELGLYLRLMTGSTIKDGNSYTYKGVQNVGTTLAQWQNGTSFMHIGNMGDKAAQALVGQIHIHDAADASKFTRVMWTCFAYDGVNDRYVSAGGNYALAEVNNGFQLLRSKAGTMSGYVRIYGVGKGA